MICRDWAESEVVEHDGVGYIFTSGEDTEGRDSRIVSS